MKRLYNKTYLAKLLLNKEKEVVKRMKETEIISVLEQYHFFLENFLKDKKEEEWRIYCKHYEYKNYILQIISCICIEFYFEKEIKHSDSDVLKHLKEFPEFQETFTVEKIMEIINIYYHPEHSVRQRCYYMDCNNSIRHLQNKYVQYDR